MNERNHRIRRERPGIFFPLILVILGLILLFSNLGMLQGDAWNTIIRLWPLLLVAIGLDSIWRRGGLVGPVLIIGLGIILLLSNFGYLQFNGWNMLLSLWPVLLIAIGLDVLIGRRSIWASFLGLIVILGVLAGALWLYQLRVGGGPVEATQIQQELQGAQAAELSFSPGVASLRIEALPDPGMLVAGEVPSGRGIQVDEMFTQTGTTAEYSLKLQNVDMVGSVGTWSNWRWDLGINPEIPIDLTVELGAGDAAIDLSGLELTGLKVDMGVGALDLTLPPGASYEASIDGAIGATSIRVPTGAGVQIVSSTGIAGFQVPDGYIKDGDVYTSPNYETAEQQIELRIDHAIGNVAIADK